MSARPHEILNLRFRDIKFHITNEKVQYAEVRITQGKTGPRTVPLIDSIPYLKEFFSLFFIFLSRFHDDLLLFASCLRANCQSLFDDTCTHLLGSFQNV